MTNVISRAFGKFASHEFPSFFQNFVNRVYVNMFNIDLSDFDQPESYKTLNALFTRALKKPRDIDSNLNSIISPTDSLITEQANVDSNKALQIKGMEYSVKEFLGEELDSSFSYINLYLSPRDYHRYHAPCDLEVLEARYFSGVLLPVNEPSLKKNKDLFIKNERVVLKARDIKGNLFFYVAVGALNVGKMLVHFEPKINTNAGNGNAVYTYQTPIKIKKGEEIGMFLMGSTIVLFIKDVLLDSSSNSKVRFGDKIARFN